MAAARGTISEESSRTTRRGRGRFLALGATVHGKIDPDSDVDRFRIDVTAAGALSVMVSPLDTLDAMLEIEDASGNVVARSDRGGARVREGVPNLGVTPGRYIAVVQAKQPRKKPPKKGAPEPARPSRRAVRESPRAWSPGGGRPSTSPTTTAARRTT